MKKDTKRKKPTAQSMADALTFYSDEKNWTFEKQEIPTGEHAGKVMLISPAYSDKGARAREALGLDVKQVKT